MFLKEKKLFETIFLQAFNGIAVVGLKGNWLQVNDSLCELLGYTRSELKNLTFQDITHIGDLEKDLTLLKELLNGDIDRYQIEKRYFHKNGTIIWAILSVSLIRDKANNPLYFVSQIIDITKKKNTEKEAEMFLSLVEEQNATFKDFVDIVSHDLRTHIGNLSTITDFIVEDFSELRSNSNFKLLKDCLLNLNDTLSQLNTTIKNKSLTNKTLKVLNLKHFIDKAFDNVRAIAKVNQFELINTVSQDLHIYAEESYFNSILINFISNSIKYKSKKRVGFVIISAEANEDYIHMSIKDNGLGLDLNRFGDQLFKPHTTFHEGKDSRGIGLYITKKHIELIGGEISVQSKPDEGTTFKLMLQKAMPVVHG